MKRDTKTNLLSLNTFKDVKHLEELITETHCEVVELSTRAHKRLFDLYKTQVTYTKEIVFYLKKVPLRIKDE